MPAVASHWHHSHIPKSISNPYRSALSFHNPLACVTGSYIIEAALSQALSTRIDVTRLGWSSGFSISIGTLKSFSLNDPTFAKMLRIKENDVTLKCKRYMCTYKSYCTSSDSVNPSVKKRTAL